MKKVTVLIALIVFFSIGSTFLGSKANLAHAEGSLILLDSDLDIKHTSVTTELEGQITFKNVTLDSKTLKVKMIFGEKTTGHTAAICTYYCFPYVSQDWDESETFSLQGGQTSTEANFGAPVTVHCKPNGVAGITNVTYRFYDVNNTSDYIDIPVKFTFGETSINDIDSKEFVVAYPNPTNSILSVYSETINIQNIRLYSVSGEEVLNEENIGNNYKTLDLSAIAKGKYLMAIYMADGSRKTQSVVVE